MVKRSFFQKESLSEDINQLPATRWKRLEYRYITLLVRMKHVWEDKNTDRFVDKLNTHKEIILLKTFQVVMGVLEMYQTAAFLLKSLFY